MITKFKYRALAMAVFITIIIFFIDYELITRTKIAMADNPIAFESQSIKQGKELYGQYCQSCHGSTGIGDGLVKDKLSNAPANLTILDQPSGITAMKIYFGSAPMPAWRDSLAMSQIWHLVNFIESIQISTQEIPTQEIANRKNNN